MTTMTTQVKIDAN